MIHQLDFPSLFISQSAAETKWPELLRALGQTVDNKTYTDTEIAQMDFETKSRLIRGDSATLVRYFNWRNHRLLLEKRAYNERCYSCPLVCICQRCSHIW